MLAVVPPPVTVRVPAKVNPHLAVGELRPDGYHDLVTIFQAVSLIDEVLVAVADEPGVVVTGEGADSVPLDESNLAWRAVLALARHVEHKLETPKIRIEIRKSIPVAGGMAGGSANAAAVLIGLAALWRLDIPRHELAQLAAKIGADVPFLLHGGTALGSSRGDEIVPILARHQFHWVLAFDRAGLNTPLVFHELDRLRDIGEPPRVGPVEAVVEALASGDPAQLAPLLGNDLQAAAISLRPGLRRTLFAGTQAGALAGIVSGSGPTCAFLCSDGDSAVRVAAELAGAGVARTIRVVHGPVPGARVLADEREPPPPDDFPLQHA